MPPPGSSADWRVELLRAISAPEVPLTVDALQWWADSEGMPAADNNWLATTLDWPGAVTVNSAGVKRYATLADGVDATAATLSGAAYSGVTRTFRQASSLVDIWSAVNASPWCSGCQGGKYPVALFDHLSSVPPPPGTSAPPRPSAADAEHAKGQAEQAWHRVRDALGPAAGRSRSRMSAAADLMRRIRR